MQGALLKGLYGLPVSEPISCPGTCTWTDEYISLGFRSNCRDVTATTTANQICTGSPGNSNRCSLTTPKGVRLTTAWVITSESTAIAVNATSTLPTSVAWTGPFSPNDFITIGVFKAPLSFNQSQITGEKILECGISLTAYRYSNISANGTETNRIVTEIPLTLDGNRATMDGDIVFKDPGLPEFRVNANEIMSLKNFIDSEGFGGSAIHGYRTGYKDPRGISVLPLLNANVTLAFEMVAQSMTNQIRVTAPDKKVGYGLTIQVVPSVEVRWYFLIGPIAIGLLAAALLVLMIVYSGGSKGVPLWKSSAVALLYHNVTSEGEITSPVRGPEELDDIARNTKAKLQ
jgi:hypothetical protein